MNVAKVLLKSGTVEADLQLFGVADELTDVKSELTQVKQPEEAVTVMNVVESTSDDQREPNERGLFVDSEEMPVDQRTL